MRINVADLCGPICVDPDDGDRLCQEATNALVLGDAACLDFTGVTTLTSSFLNAAIGCLYGKFSAADLDRRLTWSGLDETDESVLHLVQGNAVRYFSASDAQRERLVAAAHSFEHC